MSKVLVDRELLSRAADVLGSQSFSAWDEIAEQLRAFIAQPAEAEGVEVVAFQVRRTAWGTTSNLYTEKLPFVPGEGVTQYSEPTALIRLSDHLAALSAVTAEWDRLQEQCELNDMVHGTKGRERVAALLAQNEELRKDATRLDWLDGYIVIAEHEDTGKFAFNSIKGALRECVDAAMAAKEA